jgi:glycerol kinase
MRYIGALDQGTSSTRFIIFGHDGLPIADAQREHQQILPQSGWVEHDADEIWRRCKEVILEALYKAEITPSDLAAIGITNQRETTVAWDYGTGKPLHSAIVWQDTRTAQSLASLNDDDSQYITQSSGLPISAYFSASKMRWLAENCPDVQAAISHGTARFGTIDSWLLYKLTGGAHLTDVTNASRTLLMNLETLQWDPRALKIFNIPQNLLPEIRSSSEIYGYTDVNGFLKASIPIAAILGDQHAAMVGQVAFSRGDSKTTYGTGNFALLNTGSEIVRSRNGLLTTLSYKFGDQPPCYALEGSVAVTGSAVQWLRDQLGIIESAAEIEELASRVEDTDGLYFVPAFSGLFAPYWRSDARGVVVGLTRASNKNHLARAALEAICYQTRDVIEAMAADSGVRPQVMRVDGGATVNNLLMQMQSDISGCEVVRPRVTETTALGAAFAAGLAVKYWTSTDELVELWQGSHSWIPTISESDRRRGYELWKKAIERTLNWA